MSLNIGNEAKNLTQALKGKKQTQGRWGEMILESVLEFSGLLKGKHYETQESYRDDDGNIKRPDVVVKLPQNRTIIVDSKVSLNDYDRYIKADNDEKRQISAKAVVEAFKNHINTLDSKDYSKYKIGTLQYIFMFVPIEGAFALAVQEDEGLYEYALSKHIAIVTPSTLTVSLRTIYLFWQSEQSTSNAIKMFDTAGKLYDKMVIFTQNFNKIGNQIQTLGNTYENSKTQLATGSGNLMKRAEDLKTLGAKTTKSLKKSKITYSDFDEEDVDIELIEDNA
jgi:DNA recombination protein RmuC